MWPSFERIEIGCPVGNYLRFGGTTPILGTYTLRRRGGFLYRLWRCLRTLRYDWERKEWTNRLGLPNPGIRSLSFVPPKAVLSVLGFDREEWERLGRRCQLLHPLAVELNFSCPNVESKSDWRSMFAIPSFFPGVPLVGKLAPVRTEEQGKTLYDAGVKMFHLCNTVPDPRGGRSGKTLKKHSLRWVEIFRRRFGDSVYLVGSGGVDSTQDVRDYRSAGADGVSIVSMLLNPWNWPRVAELVQTAKEEWAR